MVEPVVRTFVHVAFEKWFPVPNASVGTPGSTAEGTVTTVLYAVWMSLVTVIGTRWQSIDGRKTTTLLLLLLLLHYYEMTK